jgi:hypothetical protein
MRCGILLGTLALDKVGIARSRLPRDHHNMRASAAISINPALQDVLHLRRWAVNPSLRHYRRRDRREYKQYGGKQE